MNDESLNSIIKRRFGAVEELKFQEIQTLWSGYGHIYRVFLSGERPQVVIVKKVHLRKQGNHPRGWGTHQSHLRKVKSYQVEINWYQQWAEQCTMDCRVPKCYCAEYQEEECIIILEDLDVAGFPVRRETLDLHEVKLGLKWLANFHATFMNQPAGSLWKEGTYWHLATRPDELKAMEAGQLKSAAHALDRALANTRFQTIVHGDAKVANFCFSKDMSKVAAVDFQYVGAGCGMKDVVYFLGSCLTEQECDQNEEELLRFYFEALKKALLEKKNSVNFSFIEKEWREMYPVAWADFTRFLMGWMPTHSKVNGYSSKMVQQALEYLK